MFIAALGSRCCIRNQVCILQDDLNVFQREQVYAPIYIKAFLSFLGCLNLKWTVFATEKAMAAKEKDHPSWKHHYPERKHHSGPAPNTCLNGKSLQCCRSSAGNIRAERVQFVQSVLHKSRLCSEPFPISRAPLQWDALFLRLAGRIRAEKCWGNLPLP